MQHLVIGLGEVGRAIQSILKCDGIDKNQTIDGTFDMVHICVPYGTAFSTIVKSYKRKYLAKDGVIVIHSTVAIGTSDALGAVYSPIRGKHPHLENGIRTFVKYFGGKRATEVATVFENLGISVYIAKSAKDVEALKVFDTFQYGINIAVEKELWRICQENGIDWSVAYKHANKSYNDGYEKLGYPQYKKYVLEHKNGKIGGHCVMQNLRFMHSPLVAVLRKIDIMKS